MEKTEGNLHWQIVQNLMEGFDEDRALIEIADDICSLLSQRIKAKALTEFTPEQLKQIHTDYENRPGRPDGMMSWWAWLARASAAAQLQAVLGELECR